MLLIGVDTIAAVGQCFLTSTINTFVLFFFVFLQNSNNRKIFNLSNSKLKS
jgi:hypothetical protein